MTYFDPPASPSQIYPVHVPGTAGIHINTQNFVAHIFAYIHLEAILRKKQAVDAQHILDAAYLYNQPLRSQGVPSSLVRRRPLRMAFWNIC